MAKTFVWAHRGASAYAPENTMEAFALAKEMGADGIEIDVHFSKDGRLIVAHDETVDRCSSGKGRIVDKSYQELLELDFSNHKSGYSGVKVPVLEQVLDFVRQSGLTLNIELKTGIVLYEGIEAAVTKMVRDFGVEEQVIYSSFNHYSLMLARQAEPACRIGLLYSEAMIDPALYAKRIGANALHPFYPTLQVPGTMEGARKNGILVHPWTVDGEPELKAMLALGVDAVITNRPDVALRIRDGK